MNCYMNIEKCTMRTEQLGDFLKTKYSLIPSISNNYRTYLNQNLTIYVCVYMYAF